jgi:para-nitrobenzyl esterase
MARDVISTLDYPVVDTKAGKLRGFYEDGIFTFQGIKYADAKRFQQPTPVEPWEGIKNATNYGYTSPVGGNPAPSSEIFIPHRFWPENEHCQYLNIWTPSLDKTQKRPVMVWFHGGGYSAGSSIEQVAYEGDSLAAYGDVVVVTINHRLNILGFLDMSPYGEKYANSGNAGMADIVAALQWIHDNIEAFGGDPENVLIFGQSGGGGKVGTLLQTPAAAGLFHRAVLMSGVMGTDDDTAPVDHKPIVEGLLNELHLGIDEVEKLEIVPTDILYRALTKVTAKLAKQGIAVKWAPVANGWYLGNPHVVGFAEHAKTIPTMVGNVIAEFTGMAGIPEYHKTEEEKYATLKAKYGDNTDEIIELFKQAYPGKDISRLSVLDMMFRPTSVLYAEAKSKASTAPTYLYELALDFDVMGGVPAWHCSDIPFVFHNSHRVANCNIPGVTETLEDQLAGAWVRFAYSGNPNHKGMPKWDAYGESKATMVFDRETQCRYDFDTALIKKIDETVPRLSIDELLKRKPKEEDEAEERDWMY